jgi:hypothetical protein
VVGAFRVPPPRGRGTVPGEARRQPLPLEVTTRRCGSTFLDRPLTGSGLTGRPGAVPEGDPRHSGDRPRASPHAPSAGSPARAARRSDPALVKHRIGYDEASAARAAIGERSRDDACLAAIPRVAHGRNQRRQRTHCPDLARLTTLAQVDETTIALAGIGGTLLGALGGPLIKTWLDARSGRSARFFDERVKLYAEIMSYVEDAALTLEWEVADPAERGNLRNREVPSKAELTPRILLLADEPVRRAWDHLGSAQSSMYHRYDDEAHAHDPYWPEYHDDDKADDLRAAYKEVRIVLRKQIGAG